MILIPGLYCHMRLIKVFFNVINSKYIKIIRIMYSLIKLLKSYSDFDAMICNISDLCQSHYLGKQKHKIFYKYLWTYQHLYCRQMYIIAIIEMYFVISQIEVRI